jgi:hypothetical protein
MLCQLLVAGGEGYIHPEIIHIEKNPGESITNNSFGRAFVFGLCYRSQRLESLEPLLYVPKM